MFTPLLAALPLFAAALVVTPRARQLLAGRLSSGHWGSCAATDSGLLSCWGFVDRTNPDTAHNISTYVPSIANARLVGVGGYGVCVLRAKPDACACYNTGHFPFDCTLSAAASATAVALVHGQDPWMCTLDASGAPTCFGGAGSTYVRPGPVPPGLWTELAAGWYHGCALSSVGAVACWGGRSGEQNAPQRLNATAISTRDPYTCALLSGGLAQCWGGTWCTSLPIIPPLAGFNAVAIAAGGGYSRPGSSGDTGNVCRACALNASGFLRCWASAPAAAAVPPHLQGDVAAVELGGTFSSCVVRASTAGVECWAFSEPPIGNPMAQPNVNLTLAVPPPAARGAFCGTLAVALTGWAPPAACAPPSPSPTPSPAATPSRSGTPSPTATGSLSPTAAGAPPSPGSPTPSATGSPSGGGAASDSDTPSASPTHTPSAAGAPSPSGSGTQTGSPGALPSATPPPGGSGGGGGSGSGSGSGSPSPTPSGAGSAAAPLPASVVAGAAIGGSIGALALLCLLFFFVRRPRGRAPFRKGALQAAVSWRPGGVGGGGAPLPRATAAAAVELATVASPNPLAAAGLRAGGGGGGDAQPPPPLPQQPAELPPGWERCGPDEDGDVWYQHRETGETRWDPPPALPALPAGWRMVSDGADTWYTHADGRTAWEVPVSA